MSGKAYTMQEMRDIVSYLVEKGAYSEVRARSMWQEFANCGRTKRTWQSLKETFLKRILPDIQNPYYKLTENQITSFRAGTDISKMRGNRLDVREVGESSKSNNENTNNLTEEKSAVSEDKGENFVINHENDAPNIRSSTETVVLDTAENFAVAEEVILALTEEENAGSTPSSPNKSLKDMIIFREPLTPMMQCLVGDCDSDGSNYSGSDNQLAMENGTDAVSTTTSTADTFLPNNQEGHNGTSDTTHPSTGPKTRSQAIEQSTTAPRSVLKNRNKKGEDPKGPVKKKVRLNDTVASDGGVGTSRNENGTTVDKISHKSSSRGHNARIKSKKEQSMKASVGEISSVEELIAILTDSVLPNNQEGIKALKKFFETQGNKDDKSDVLSEDKTTNDNKANSSEEAAVMQVDSDSQSSEILNILEQEHKITTRKANKIKEITGSENIDSQIINMDSDGEKSNQDKRVTRNPRKKNDVKIAGNKVDSESINSSKTTISKAPESAEDESNIRNTRAKKNNADDNEKYTILIQSNDTLSGLEENIRARSPSPIICQLKIGLRDKKNVTPNKVEDQQQEINKNANLSSNAKKAKLSPSVEPESPKTRPPEDVARVVGESDKEQKSTKSEITQKHNVDCADDDDVIIVYPENTEQEEILTEVRKIDIIKPQDIEKTSAKPDIESCEKHAKDTEDKVTTDKSVKNLNKVSTKVITDQEGTSETSVRADKIINNNVESPPNTNFYTALDNASDLPCGNPCLQNASVEESKKENQMKAVHAKKKGRTVVLLPSHSDTDSDTSLETARRPKRAMGVRGANVLSRIFGLCDGNIRNRRRPHTKRNAARDHYKSETSESSSEEHVDHDLIPIPGNKPGHRVRYMRRPVEGRVEALPEGALVAVYNGHIYRIVAQRGRRVYNLSYSKPGEQKQTEPPCNTDLESSTRHEDGPGSTSRSVPAAAPASLVPADPVSAAASKNASEERLAPEKIATNPQVAVPACDQASVVLTKDKITFSGNADKIISMLPHFPTVMKGLFGTANCAEIGVPEAAEKPELKDENNLDDEEVRKRVAAREAAIFREIEERDAKRSSEELDAVERSGRQRSSEETRPKTEEPQQRPKSTRSKRPPKKMTSSLDAPVPPSRDDEVEHVSESDHEIIIQEEGRKRGAQGEGGQQEGKKRTRRPKQDKEPSVERVLGSDDEVLYSLPSQAAASGSVSQRRTLHKPSKLRAKEYEELSQDMEESTQGYLDSDISFIELRPKRRRRTHHVDSRRKSMALVKERSRKSYNSQPYNLRRNSVTRTQLQLLQVLSSGDENLQDKEVEHLSLSAKEVVPDSDETLHLTPIPETVGSTDVSLPGLDTVPDSKYVKDAGNSSNVSLPLSPEISIVENISTRSSSICRNNHCHTINELLTMSNNQEKSHSRKVSILPDDINFNCPLMEQDLAITSGVTSEQISQRESNHSSVEEMELCVTNLNEFDEKCEGNTSKTQGNGATVTESLLSKVIDININDTPFSESIQNGIVNLRLNSENRSSPSEKTLRDGKPPKVSAKGKSRCSTPNKKSKFRKSQPPLIGNVIEEESMQVEYCSKKKRLSCPLLIDIDRIENSAQSNFKMPISQPAKINNPRIVVTPADTNNVTIRKWKIRTPSKPKPKIIKVKILKPTSKTVESPKKTDNNDKKKHSTIGERNSLPPKAPKSKKSDERKSSSGQSSTNSACSSTELIHNHSDTCLAAQECMTRSSGSEGNASDSGVALRRHIFTPSPDCFSSEAQDGNENLETASLSPNVPVNLSNLGSLLTEETPPSGSSSWYLLSEDEEESLLDSDRRLSQKEEDVILLAKYGPHIASLYPCACAIPELSTITENSSDTRGSVVQHRTTPACSIDGLPTPSSDQGEGRTFP